MKRYKRQLFRFSFHFENQIAKPNKFGLKWLKNTSGCLGGRKGRASVGVLEKQSQSFLSVQHTVLSLKPFFSDTALKLNFFSFSPLHCYKQSPVEILLFIILFFFSVNIYVSFNSSPFRPSKFSSCHLTFKVVFLNNKAVLNIVESRQHNVPEISQ